MIMYERKLYKNYIKYYGLDYDLYLLYLWLS